MADLIFWGIVTFFLGYAAGKVATRLSERRLQRQRARRVAPRGTVGILVVRAPLAPQAVRREWPVAEHSGGGAS